MSSEPATEAQTGAMEARGPTGPSKYYRARYYDPRLGRFISEDPIGFEAGVNFYSYVDNRPVNVKDPLGLDGGSGMGWPGHGGPGPKPPTWHDTWQDWYDRANSDPGVGWRYAHCTASCQTAKHSGQTTAKYSSPEVR